MNIDYDLVERIGATHYKDFLLYKVEHGELFVHFNGMWSKSELALGDAILKVKPIQKPRTRTEYEKVTESIFDLRDEFERGELHTKGRGAGGDFFKKITTEYELITFASCGLYRKVEKEIDWRDDVYEWQHTAKVGIYTPLDFTVAHLISVHPDKFLELCRVALRANGELE